MQINMFRASELLGLSFFFATFSFCACSFAVPKPPNVSEHARFVAGSKSGWWQDCKFTGVDQPLRCRIWNRGGLILYDEVFQPYDEGKAPTESELEIDDQGNLAGPNEICLKNGRLLLPSSRFLELKAFYKSVEASGSVR